MNLTPSPSPQVERGINTSVKLALERCVEGDGRANEGARDGATGLRFFGEFVELFLADTGDNRLYIQGDVLNYWPFVVASQSTALQPLSLAETLSRSVMATIGGPKSLVTRSAASRKPSMFN